MIDLMIGGKEYHLKMTTRTALELEKKLGGVNPIKALTDESLSSQMLIFCYAFKKYHPELTYEDVLDLHDEYIEEGHDMIDFQLLLVDIFKDSGVMGNIDLEGAMNDPNAFMRAKLSHSKK